MATIQNPYDRIDPTLGTRQRDTLGQDLAGVVASALSAYGKKREVDREFTEKEDRERGESEMIAYNDRLVENRKLRTENGYYNGAMTPEQKMQFHSEEKARLDELTANFGSSWYKTKKFSIDSSYDDEHNREYEVYTKKLLGEFVPSQLAALSLDKTSTGEDYSKLYESAKTIRGDYTEGDFVNDGIKSLKEVLGNMPLEEYSPSEGKALAYGLLEFTKDGNNVNMVNSLVEAKTNQYKDWYSDKFREASFALLYNESGTYNTKDLRNFQKELDSNDSLTVSTKASLFQRVESIFSYLKSQAASSAGEYGKNAKIDLINNLDKLIESTGTNGENREANEMSSLKEKIVGLSPYLKSTDINTLQKKVEQIEFNTSARNNVLDLVNASMSGDATALAALNKAKNNGIQIDTKDGFTKNIPSSFVNAEIAKITQARDEQISNNFGYVQVKDKDGNETVKFDENKFFAETVQALNITNKIGASGGLIEKTASDLANNTPLTANNPTDYMKIVLADYANKQINNKLTDADEFRYARMKQVYDEYKKSNSEDKDEKYLQRMIVEKQSAHVRNSGLKYQSKLSEWVKESKDYVEGRSGFSSPFITNTSIDDRSLNAYQTFINKQGTIMKDRDEVEKDMDSRSMAIQFGVINAQEKFFKPNGVTEEEVKRAISQIIGDKELGEGIDSSSINIYNTLSSDGGLDIVIEKKDSNGTQQMSIGSKEIKQLMQKNLDVEKDKDKAKSNRINKIIENRNILNR